MKILPTALPDALILEPDIFPDERGFFLESYNKREFAKTGIHGEFVQDNHSHSVRGVLRGLHYQLARPQGKLVRALTGAVFSVAVDLRRSSPEFGRAIGIELSAGNKRALWVPPGFAHGFLVLSESADYLYKTTDYHAPEDEHCLLWNDPDLAIGWPFPGSPILSEKDRRGLRLRDCPVYP